MKLDPEAITQAAEEAYAAAVEYHRVAGAYQVMKENNKWPALPHPPTLEQYNEWVEAKKRHWVEKEEDDG